MPATPERPAQSRLPGRARGQPGKTVGPHNGQCTLAADRRPTVALERILALAAAICHHHKAGQPTFGHWSPTTTELRVIRLASASRSATQVKLRGTSSARCPPSVGGRPGAQGQSRQGTASRPSQSPHRGQGALHGGAAPSRRAAVLPVEPRAPDHVPLGGGYQEGAATAERKVAAKDLPSVDLVICGSVAVNRQGARNQDKIAEVPALAALAAGR
jgi:hypothetical protein